MPMEYDGVPGIGRWLSQRSIQLFAMSEDLPDPENRVLCDDTGGGAVMDVGYYAVDACRFLVGSEPTVRAAKAQLERPQVKNATPLPRPSTSAWPGASPTSDVSTLVR